MNSLDRLEQDLREKAIVYALDQSSKYTISTGRFENMVNRFYLFLKTGKWENEKARV